MTELAANNRTSAPPIIAEPDAIPPTWRRWTEIPRVVAYPPFLRKTIRIALIVGAILFAINHLDEVLAGKATAPVWIKGVLTCLVPFVVSNLGVLIAARRPDSRGPRPPI